LLAQEFLGRWFAEPDAVVLDEALFARAQRLFAVFLAGALYFVLLWQLTYAYFSRNDAFVRFILFEGGIYPLLFWLGFVVVGTVLPLYLTLTTGGNPRLRLRWAAVATVVGAFAFLYLFIIGGQAYPLQPFAGYTVVASGFDDGRVASYLPRWPEWFLASGGVGLSLLIFTVGVRVWPFTPVRARP